MTPVQISWCGLGSVRKSLPSLGFKLMHRGMRSASTLMQDMPSMAPTSVLLTSVTKTDPHPVVSFVDNLRLPVIVTLPSAVSTTSTGEVKQGSADLPRRVVPAVFRPPRTHHIRRSSVASLESRSRTAWYAAASRTLAQSRHIVSKSIKPNYVGRDGSCVVIDFRQDHVVVRRSVIASELAFAERSR